MIFFIMYFCSGCLLLCIPKKKMTLSAVYLLRVHSSGLMVKGRQGEPNNDRGNEDCIAVGWGKNLWNDVKCSVNWFAGFVCKKDSFI